jgi:hypothetical protein
MQDGKLKVVAGPRWKGASRPNDFVTDQRGRRTSKSPAGRFLSPYFEGEFGRAAGKQAKLEAFET